jgi:hypothetical protein
MTTDATDTPATPEPKGYLELSIARAFGETARVEVRPSGQPDAPPVTFDLSATHRVTIARVEAGATPDEPGASNVRYDFRKLPADAPTVELRGELELSLVVRLAGFVRYLRSSGHFGAYEWNATRDVPFVNASIGLHNIVHATPDELDAAARDALRREGVDDDEARALLVDALAAEREPLTDAVPLPTTGPEVRELVDGVPRMDEAFAAYLEKLSAPDTIVRAVRANGRKRGTSEATFYDLWLEGIATKNERGKAPAVLPTLALALWHARVRERLGKHVAKRPALAMVVHEPVADLFSRGLRREEERDGQRVLALPGDVLVRVAHVDASVIPKFVDRGIAAFGGVTAHKVLRWQVFTGHRQALDGAADARVIRVDGAYETIAREYLGSTSRKAVDEVRAIIEAEHAIEVPLPTGSTRLLIRTYRPAVGRRASHLELVLGTALLPDYVHELRELGAGRDMRRARRLVPVLDVPPLIGRPNEHGAQASLSMLVAAHMRDNARELVETGGVTITAADWDRLAGRAGLPVRMVPAVLDRWTQDGDDARAFLRRVERDRYVLTDAKAHAFLEEGGRGEIAGSEAGKASVEKRERAKVRALRRAPK